MGRGFGFAHDFLENGVVPFSDGQFLFHFPEGGGGAFGRFFFDRDGGRADANPIACVQLGGFDSLLVHIGAVFRFKILNEICAIHQSYATMKPRRLFIFEDNIGFGTAPDGYRLIRQGDFHLCSIWSFIFQYHNDTHPARRVVYRFESRESIC